MEERQLVDAISNALKENEFVRIQKEVSSRSITLSAHKGDRTVVVHIADPSPAPGPRFAVNPDTPEPSEIRTRARVPSLQGRSGSGGPSQRAHSRKNSSR